MSRMRCAKLTMNLRFELTVITITSAELAWWLSFSEPRIDAKARQDLLGRTRLPCGREPPFPRVNGELATGDGHFDKLRTRWEMNQLLVRRKLEEREWGTIWGLTLDRGSLSWVSQHCETAAPSSLSVHHYSSFWTRIIQFAKHSVYIFWELSQGFTQATTMHLTSLVDRVPYLRYFRE